MNTMSFSFPINMSFLSNKYRNKFESTNYWSTCSQRRRYDVECAREIWRVLYMTACVHVLVKSCPQLGAAD